MSSLSHHGVKGQKWGVRRYQNKDGSWTEEGLRRQRQNRISKQSEDVRQIYKSLSDQDLKLLAYDDSDIARLRDTDFEDFNEVSDKIAHRVIKRDKNGIPVAYADVTSFTSDDLETGKKLVKAISIDLATRGGADYRGKGYAVSVGKQMVRWFDEYGYKDYDHIEWFAKSDNIASQKTAEKVGFKKMKYRDGVSDDPGWVGYSYRKIKHSSLSHHGVKGQKWGVRRYQNYDGTRTALGKRRDFERTASKVVENSSNSPKPFVRRPFNKDKIRQRGLITQAEADQCAGLASGVFKQASQAEPKITSDVIDVVSSTSAKMYGLDYRLKQPTSIAAKIGADAKADGVTFEQAAGGLKDVIRYTAVSDNRDYVDTYNAIKQRLEEKGYTETKCKNYFQKYQNGEVMHKAVQSTFRSPDGVEFEVQFQTPESQAAKELKVPIYNERRKAGNTPERNAELEQEMRNLAEQVPDPEGVFGIESHSGAKNMKHSSLSHYGVKGQRHGVRQYQYEDGTLTPLGREHYGYGDEEFQRRRTEAAKSRKEVLKNMDLFTTDELQELSARFNAEDQLKRENIEKGLQVMSDLAQVANNVYVIGSALGYFGAAEHSSLGGTMYDRQLEHSSMTGDGMLVVDGILYLEHHGVKGQKHGVRQYQNYDGSLTPLGRIHYGYGQARSKAGPVVTNALKKTGQAAGIVSNAFKEARRAAAAASEERRERKQAKLKEKASKDRSSVLKNRNLFTTKELEDLEKRFTAEDKLRANIPDKKALRKAASDQKAAEKLAERKEKASQTREGVLRNKKLFTNEELKALSERFNTEDKIKQESIDKGLAAVKNLANAAQSVQTIVNVFEDVSGFNISPIKKAQAEQKKAWDLEDRQRKQKFEDTKEAREEGKYKREEAAAAAKEKRDIETWERDKQRADAKEQREIEQVEYQRKRDRVKDQRERAERLIKKRQDAEDRKRKLARDDAEDRRKAAEEIRKIKKEAAEERRKAITGKNLAKKQKAEARLAEIKAIEAAMGLSNNKDLTDFEEWLRTIDPTWTRHDSFDSDYIIQNGVLMINPAERR